MPNRANYRDKAVQENADATLITVGKVSTIVGGSTAFVGGLSASDLAAFAGIAGMAVGLFIQWYYTRRKDRREAARDAERGRREAVEHAARMESYRHGRIE